MTAAYESQTLNLENGRCVLGQTEAEVARLRAELSKSFAETEAAEVKCDNLSASFEVITSRLEAAEAELEIKKVLYEKALAREQAAEAKVSSETDAKNKIWRDLQAADAVAVARWDEMQEQRARAEAAERERDAAMALYEASTRTGVLAEAIADTLRAETALAQWRQIGQTIWELCRLAADIGRPVPLPASMVRDLEAALANTEV
jgi:chromosome segregation ATPase